MTTVSGRPNKRRELGEKSKGEILDAALAAMSTFGYEGATIARIAAASGLPASSIYWHFGSKAGVLAAVMERGTTEFFAEYDREFRPAIEVTDVRATLETALSAGARAAAHHPEFLRLMILLGLSGELDDRVATVVRQTSERGRAQLREMIHHAFSSYGPATANRVAEALADVAQANFDGAFLATQIRDQVSAEVLANRLAETLYLLGLEIVNESP